MFCLQYGRRTWTWAIRIVLSGYAGGLAGLSYMISGDGAAGFFCGEGRLHALHGDCHNRVNYVA